MTPFRSGKLRHRISRILATARARSSSSREERVEERTPFLNRRVRVGARADAVHVKRGSTADVPGRSVLPRNASRLIEIAVVHSLHKLRYVAWVSWVGEWMGR